MKKIFISHSSKDFSFAKSLCDLLENQNINCWIAPRDIPYGEWSEKITLAIEQSKIMVFVFSENSNKSKQVLREIKLAIENNVMIIPVRISKEEYNPSLKYFLALYQWEDVDSDDIVPLNKVVNKIKCLINLEDYNETDMNNIDYNTESEIIRGNFYELFADSLTHEEKPTPSPFRGKLLDRVGDKFMKEFWKISEVQDSNDFDNGKVEEHTNKGLYFTLKEDKSVRTLMFIVRRKFVQPDYQSKYIAEPLDCKISGIINKKSTYFVDSPDPLGNPLIQISFLKDSKTAIANLGFIDSETSTLKICNHPEIYEYKEIQNKEENFNMKLEVSEDQTAIIIDFETFSCVPQKKYFDISKQEWVYYVELSKNKNYFAFTVNPTGVNNEISSSFTIALGYYYGCYGLRKSIIDAAEWFDKCDTKEAYYYLAKIFKEDPLLSNVDDYHYYLKKYNELNN